MQIDPARTAMIITAAVALMGFLTVSVKQIIAVGKLIAVVEKVPSEMAGIRQELQDATSLLRQDLRDATGDLREELRIATATTLQLTQGLSERAAVMEKMLDLDSKSQAKAGPRLRVRGREL